MKVGIFDKWLNALGGGEKVATVMAEVLSKAGHDVQLISNFEIDKKELSEKMGADLTKVKLTAWFERSYVKLLPKIKEFDLFINVSFLDHSPSSAKKSVYYVHFPTPIKKNFLGFIKYEKILPFLRRFLLIPEIHSGLKPIEDVYTRGGKWLGKENTVVFSNTPDKTDLTLRIYAEKLKANTIESVSFTSPNAKLEVEDKYIDHHFNILVFKLNINSKNKSPAIKIKIKEDMRLNAFGLVSMTVRNIRFIAWNLLKKFLPQHEMALYGSSGYKLAEGLEDYDLFLANSEFTKSWIENYWDKEARVLYPPIDVEKFKKGKKKNIILNVGRFFVGGHSKRQDVLLEVFKEMVDKGRLDKTWELHFVGGVAGGKDHTDYLNKLQSEAKGYNVEFHLFADFKKLKKLYSQAKIYWHATGYGVNENQEPIKMEHFGITPVEAMAAAAVPVVYNGGGVKEVVNEESGFTWLTKNDLIKKTQRLVSNDELRKKLSAKGVKRAKRFSVRKFEEQLLDLVSEISNKA